MNASFHVIWPYLRRQWRALALASAATVVIAAAEVLRPFPLKFVIDAIFGAAKSGHFTIGPSEIALVLGVAALVLAISLVEAAGDYITDVHLERAGERIVHELRVAIYAQLQRLSLGFHRQRHTGDLVTRVTGDVSAVGDIFSSTGGTLAASALTLVFMIVVGFLIDPLLAVVAFATTPLVGFVALRFRQRMAHLQRRQRAMEGEIASMATETLSSIEQVKALGVEQFEHDRLARKSEERRVAGFEATLAEGQFTRLIDIVGAITTALVLIVGVFRVSDGVLSPGDLVVMVTYVRRVYKPLRDIAREWVRFSRSMARAERVAELLSSDDMLEERPVAARQGRARGELVFDNVSFTYSADRPALLDVQLSIRAGERLAIIGPSGAGKSTLAALAARFYDPSAGRVLVDGEDARNVPLRWLRDQVGLVLQDPVLFTGSVAENIAWGIDADREAVIRAAQSVGADEFIRELPDGYDTQLDPGGSGLSGGQRQRIAIARTLLRDPAILLLDEPTTGLDAASESKVLSGLDVLMAARTTVIITHSIPLAGRAERVAVMDGGRLVRTGSPVDLLTATPVVTRPAERARAPQAPTARKMQPSPKALPDDPSLPGLATLLDTTRVAPILGRSFNGGTPLTARVLYLRYKPGTNLVVHYEVTANGGTHDAVGMIATGNTLATRAARPEVAALAAAVVGRTIAATPLAYEDDVGALVQWYPLDLALPVLVHHPRELRRALGSLGVRVHDSDDEPKRLAYKPRRRAVLRVDDHVVRLYARQLDFERAVAGQRAAGARRDVRTPRLEAVDPARMMTVQSLVAGAPVTDAISAACSAGRTLAALHETRLTHLRDFTPGDQLSGAVAAARLVKAVAPELTEDVDELLALLSSSVPQNVVPVPSHGDFSAGQLLKHGERMTMIDFDEFCLSSPALDPAAYAADLVRGGPSDLELARTALDDLRSGYGRPIRDIPWYLATMILRQAPWPFRHFADDWPLRLARIVADAREVYGNA